LIVSGRTGVGLGGMRERLRQLDGTLDIKSDENGTVVSAILKIG
jgi:signal transduction histidine kinase